MEPFMVIVLFIVVAAVVGLVAWLAWQAEKKRREELVRFAQALGLSYTPDDPMGLPRLLSHVGEFNKGHSREAKNVMRGNYRGRDVVAFDYKYTTTEHYTDSKGRSHTREVNHRFSACIHPLECPFPHLAIRPEGLLDKVGDFFGFDDIDFESDEFSRKFRVMSEDRKFAYDVCHPRMMEWMLANRGWHMETSGGWWVLTDGSRWDAQRFHSAVAFTAKFFDTIPEFVWKEYREKAGMTGEQV